jgi:hypothetical protein
MYSSSDFEKLRFLYKTEGEFQGISINSFCLRQGALYRDFNSWFVKTCKKTFLFRLKVFLLLIPLWKNPPFQFVAESALIQTHPQMTPDNSLRVLSKSKSTT